MSLHRVPTSLPLLVALAFQEAPYRVTAVGLPASLISGAPSHPIRKSSRLEAMKGKTETNQAFCFVFSESSAHLYINLNADVLFPGSVLLTRNGLIVVLKKVLSQRFVSL